MPGTNGSIYTISDERIRALDISPVLGRGYSIMTNQFHSTCLLVDETTVPSYDYEYDFTDYSGHSTYESQHKSSSSSSSSRTRYKFGWFSITQIKTSVARQSSSSSTSKSESQWRTMSATMRIERYYSSVREEVSPLSASAKSLLTNEDYVGFFKACGPNYTRGIRRAQEITAIFQFQSSSVESARSYASAVQRSESKRKNWGRRRTNTSSNSYSSKSKYKGINRSLRITIIGYGLGLSQEGSETLVATTMAQHKKVLQFAFNSMTRNDDAHHIGMVYGIEIVPWVHNTGFQAAAKLGEVLIEIPMPRSLIPKVVNGACENINFEKDKYGYCCELDQLFNPTTKTYTGVGATPSTHICKPIRALDPALIKDNMSNNGEFVARLDGALRYRMTALGALEKCISAVNAIPRSQLTNILKTQDSVKYDGLIEITISAAELKMAIDPTSDYGIMRVMAMEMNEWIEMFMEPCYAALFGTNVGFTPDVDVTYFMAYPWHHHDECMKLTCLTNNMRWDRKTGKSCVPSIVSGRQAKDYDGAAKCATELDLYDQEVCKNKEDYLDTQLTKFKKCWGDNTIPNVDHMINYFCLPQLTTTKSKIAGNLLASLDACNPPPVV